MNTESVVSIMVDNSGSMDRGNKGLYAQRMCIGLGKTLERMGIPFEILGFTTRNSGGQKGGVRISPIHINEIKTFESRFQPHRALFPYDVSSGNADMELMSIMIARLKDRPEPKKIFFGISDGAPCGNGYPNYDDLYASMIEQAKQDGIYVYGFGIGSGARVERYYGKDCSTTIHTGNVKTFPATVMEQLTKLLGST